MKRILSILICIIYCVVLCGCQFIGFYTAEEAFSKDKLPTPKPTNTPAPVTPIPGQPVFDEIIDNYRITSIFQDVYISNKYVLANEEMFIVAIIYEESADTSIVPFINITEINDKLNGEITIFTIYDNTGKDYCINLRNKEMRSFKKIIDKIEITDKS